MSVLKPGEVEFVVGDERFTLTLKTGGLIALQKRFSVGDRIADVQAILEKAAAGSIEHVTAIMWAAFQKYHPDVTFERAVDLIDEAGGLDRVSQQLGVLSESTQPDPADVKELAEENPRTAQAKRGPGGRSRSRPSASV